MRTARTQKQLPQIDPPELAKNIKRLPPRPLSLARVRKIYESLAQLNDRQRKLEREQSSIGYGLSCIWFDLHEFFSRVRFKTVGEIRQERALKKKR